MSRRSNNFKRGEALFEKSKKDVKQPKNNQNIAKDMKSDGSHLHSKQVESRIQYINFKQDEELNINRLDLIFQKEPKEIQAKLMKLLISYNATLQYNRNTDLFEVDLLLPFLNEEEKREFIRQFLQIRRNQKPQNTEQKPNPNNISGQGRQFKKELSKGSNLSQSKEIRKFSFNNNIKFSNQFEEQVQHNSEEMMGQLNYEEQNIEEQKRKLLFVSDQNNSYTKEQEQSLPHLQKKQLNLNALQQSISQRLKKAITIINRKKGKEEKNKENEGNFRSILINEQEIQKEQSIIDKLVENNLFNDSQKMSEERHSLYIKEDVGQTQQPSEERLFGRNHFDEYNIINNYHSEKFAEVIEQQQEEEEYEPLFNNKNVDLKPKKGEKVTSFQDYTKKYATLKQEKGTKKQINKPTKTAEKLKQENQVNVPKNYFSSKEKDQFKDSNNLFDAPKKNKKPEDRASNKSKVAGGNEKVRSRQSSSHSRSISARKQSPSKQSLEIKQHLNDFFNQHKQNLQGIYSQIRNKIKSQISKPPPVQKMREIELFKGPQKVSDDFYILVQDDLQHEQSHETSRSDFPYSKQFKSQILKEYEKEILINSKNLSSQDLIRYFKYLHSNAKKLYVKYLINKRK